MVDLHGPAARNVDSALKDFDSVPLFMKSLPNEEANDSVIQALQALAHEGTPDGV